MSFCSLSIVLMALPREAFGARLNETVIDGNCPWCVIESGWVVVSKCENALSGMAWLGLTVVAPAALTPVVPAVRTRVAGASELADGVYIAEAVSAFEPAEVEPLPEELEAPAPLVPVAAFAWMKMWFSLSGSSWNCGCASRITWY